MLFGEAIKYATSKKKTENDNLESHSLAKTCSLSLSVLVSFCSLLWWFGVTLTRWFRGRASEHFAEFERIFAELDQAHRASLSQPKPKPRHHRSVARDSPPAVCGLERCLSLCYCRQCSTA